MKKMLLLLSLFLLPFPTVACASGRVGPTNTNDTKGREIHGSLNSSITTPTSQGRMEKRKRARVGSIAQRKSKQKGSVGRKLMSWVPYWDQENALQSFRGHAQLFDSLSFFWYHLDAKGNIQPYKDANTDPQIIREVKERGVKTFVLVANLPEEDGGDWDAVRVERVIASDAARSVHIQDLLKLVEKYHFDGIDIDYEALEKGQRENFSRFIIELASALHAKGKLLGVALHPKTSEGNPEEENGSQAQDWKKLSLHADRLYLMAFGEHYSGSEPGPVASLAWMDRILHFAVTILRIPGEKLFVEIPLYAENWMEEREGKYVGAGEDMTLREAEELGHKFGGTFSWDEIVKSPFITYKQSGKEHIIWTENVQSIREKLSIMAKYRLSQLGYWRAGAETNGVWEAFSNWKK